MKNMYEVIRNCHPLEVGNTYLVEQWEDEKVSRAFEGTIYPIDRFVDIMSLKFPQSAGVYEMSVMLTSLGMTHFITGDKKKDYCSLDNDLLMMGYQTSTYGSVLTFTEIGEEK